MTDLEYAAKIAGELIPTPEMAGSAQLRRSIAKAIIRARSLEAHKCGMELGGWASSQCFQRARELRELCDGSASSTTAPAAALQQPETGASLVSQKQEGKA
jgi:hypothetical protein